MFGCTSTITCTCKFNTNTYVLPHSKLCHVIHSPINSQYSPIPFILFSHSAAPNCSSSSSKRENCKYSLHICSVNCFKLQMMHGVITTGAFQNAQHVKKKTKGPQAVLFNSGLLVAVLNELRSLCI